MKNGKNQNGNSNNRKTTTKKLLPHELIIKIIRNASHHDLSWIIKIIKNIEIMQSHDEIILALSTKLDELCLSHIPFSEAIEGIQRQKFTAEKARVQRTNLDKLRSETRALSALLSDYKLDDERWLKFMQERMDETYHTIAKILDR